MDELPFHVLVWKVRCCGAGCLENRLELCYCGNFLRDKWHKGAFAEYSISCCGFAFSDIQESITINNCSWCQTVSSVHLCILQMKIPGQIPCGRYGMILPSQRLLNPQVLLQLIWQIFSCPGSPDSRPNCCRHVAKLIYVPIPSDQDNIFAFKFHTSGEIHEKVSFRVEVPLKGYKSIIMKVAL